MSVTNRAAIQQSPTIAAHLGQSQFGADNLISGEDLTGAQALS
jgi:hypothetical protein